MIDFLASRAAYPVIRKYALDPVSAPRDQQTLATDFAPFGPLRAVINLGNPVLARRAKGQTEPTGVSVDLARALADHLALTPELVVVNSAGAAVDAIAKGDADIGFFAIDPLRAKEVDFTAAYLNIEGAYAVADGSQIRDLAEVDKAGVRIAVGKGSAYDLYLTREIKAATLVRAPTSQDVVPLFLKQKLDVAAGVRQQIDAAVAAHPGQLRVLPGRFMKIDQAMGIAAGRGSKAVETLTRFVEDMKAKGFVAEAL